MSNIKVISKILSYLGLFFCSSGIMAPLWSNYVYTINGDLRTSGIALGVFTITYGIFSIITGPFISRIRNVRLVTTVSYFIYGFIACGYLLVKSPDELYIVQFLLGFIYALQSTAADTLYGDIIPANHEAVGWGIYILSFNVSVGLGAIIGSHLAFHVGYDAVFLTIAGLAFLASLLSLIINYGLENSAHA